VRRAETQFARNLRAVAKHVGSLVSHYDPADPHSLAQLQHELSRYAYIIEPWAKRTAQRMLLEVSSRDKKAWSEYALTMSREVHREIEDAPTGHVLRRLLGEQVKLITSLPTEAGQRVHKLTLEALSTGARASEIAKEIARSGEVTASRANLIARTEVAKTASSLVQARSEFVGSEGYIWRTAKDSDVRPSHKKMEGKFVRWDDPPALDKMTGHAGHFPNCRCYPEPVIPDDL
jgi:SPP1 gp7 family putative phage head morphogenesis protein